MLTSRPDRKPNLTLTNLRVEEDCDDSIFYNFAEARNQDKTEFWKIPTNSTFEPNCEILPNTAYAVWSKMIDEPYVTSKGKQRTRARHEWEWIEPLEDYMFSTQSETTRNMKNQVVADAYIKMIEAQTNFTTLFEQINPAVAKRRAK